jgi:hypothetical protein
MGDSVMRSRGLRNQPLSIVTVRRLLVIGLTVAELAFFQPSGLAQATLDKAAVPSSAAAAAARRAVDGIYKSAVSDSKTASQRSALARTVLSDSALAKTDAERYAMLSLAISLSEQGDDGMLVLEVSDQIASSFSVDATRLLAEILPRSSADPRAEDWAAWSKAVSAAFNTSLAAGRFDDAEKLLTVFSNRARKSRDPKAQASTTAMKKRLVISRKQANVLTELQEAAAAPAATAKEVGRLGKHLCFVRNDWARGLTYLARGDDSQLAAAARRELERDVATDPAHAVAVADGWAAVDSKLPSTEQAAVFSHAIDLYLLALPALEGLRKVQAQRALDDLRKRAGEKGAGKSSWLTVFRSDSSEIWNTDTGDSPNRFATALDTVPEGIRYVRIRRANGDAVIVPVNNEQLGGLARGERFGWQGGKPEIYKGFLLGIFDAKTNLINQPKVFVYVHARDYFSGYGFGHQYQTVGPAVAVWDSQAIPGEVLEISVTAGQLNAAEQELLLR